MRNLGLGFALFLAAGSAGAQIVGNGLGTSVSSPTGAVTISGGTSVGNNLFHSFGTFNVATGDSATFTGGASIVNIVARITGGSASSIDGTIRSNIAGANVWLFNPSGMAFGPNASLDVSGSFHAGTAHAVKFASSGQFDLANPPAGTLTISPTAFVFLSPPAPITVTGSQLSVGSGKQLTLAGGDLTITGATLHAPAGQINLASVAGAGEVTLGAGSLMATGTAATSQITLANSNVNTWSAPSTPGPTSGPIFIRGGKLTIDQATVSTEHTGATAGGIIDIALAGDLAMNGGLVLATGLGTGAAGNVTIGAANVSMANTSVIDTSGLDIVSFTGGQSGQTTINASGDVALASGSQVTSATMTGTGGDVQVTARTLSVTGASSTINVVTVGSGTGGNVVINAANVSVADAGRISAGNETVGAIGPSAGNGGNITINASGGVSVSGSGASGGIRSGNAGFGSAGSISITAGDAITLTGDGAIATSTAFGAGGQIHLVAGNLLSLDHSRITTSVADGSGNGGDITIDPVFVTLNASQIIAQAVGGNGGNITITTQFFTMSPDSLVDASSQFAQSGSVSISSPNVDAGSALTILPSGYFDPSSLLRESCAARGGRVASTFTGAGRGALPAGPDAAGYGAYALGSSSVVLAAAPRRAGWLSSNSALQGCSG